MKKRQGYVSNSSSSTFIVAFDQVPDKDYLKKVLFNDVTSVDDNYNSNTWHVNDLCDFIMKSMDHKLSTIHEIAEQLRQGYITDDNSPISPMDLKDYNDITNEDWEKYNRKEMDWSINKAKKFVDDNLNKLIMILEFGDDTSIGSQVEHGHVFDNLTHIIISNH